MLEFINEASKIISDTELIKATVKRTSTPMELGGMKINLDAEGMEILIPKWASDKMMKDGLIEVKYIEELGIKDLRKTLWKESRETNLTKIDPQFYMKARATIKRLMDDIKRDPTPEKIQEERKYRDAFMDIVNCRMQKVLQLAITESIPQTISENMTIEERILLKEIKRMLTTWKDQVTRIGDET
ncbi:MAG: DNA replication complex GINS family protein [Candidatus Verstraetearchaeota archaeon]|jgi:hypothetical protein|nr:DNA replication complex GINS family protein [Candidatus Verstraetearchaeota archaeon]